MIKIGQMGMKKIIIVALLPLLFVTLLSSQSLVELAKKEKERRAKLKGKKGIVITNSDLKKSKRQPAVSIPLTESAEKESPGATRTPKSSPPKRVPSYPIRKISQQGLKSLTRLEEKRKKANGYVNLLTLKIKGLQQKFFTFMDWTSKDLVQRETWETYLKLQKARQDAEKAKKELYNQRAKKRK